MRAEVGLQDTRSILHRLRVRVGASVESMVRTSAALAGGADPLDDASVTADLQTIEEAARRLRSIVETILDPARIEAGDLDVSWVRHELRTPLTHILGFAHMVLEDAGPRPAATRIGGLREITAAVQSCLEFLEDTRGPLPLAPSAPGAAHDARAEFKEAPAPSPPRGFSTMEEGRVDGAEPAKRRVLLVEDNPVNSDMLTRRLTRQGLEIVVAHDGGEGIALAHASVPDLILMDMSLPVVDGWEATRRLKAAPQTAAIPIIGLSAHAMPSDRERALQAGCDDYETKPIDLARLLAKMTALMQAR